MSNPTRPAPRSRGVEELRRGVMRSAPVSSDRAGCPGKQRQKTAVNGPYDPPDPSPYDTGRQVISGEEGYELPETGPDEPALPPYNHGDFQEQPGTRGKRPVRAGEVISLEDKDSGAMRPADINDTVGNIRASEIQADDISGLHELRLHGGQDQDITGPQKRIHAVSPKRYPSIILSVFLYHRSDCAAGTNPAPSPGWCFLTVPFQPVL